MRSLRRLWPQRPRITPREAQALLDLWVTRLNLQGWKIQLGLARSSEAGGTINHGSTSWDRKCSTAKITLSKVQKDFQGGPVAWDPEVTLVHELLHLQFCIQSKNQAEDFFLEQGIERTARVLVEAYGRSF